MVSAKKVVGWVLFAEVVVVLVLSPVLLAWGWMEPLVQALFWGDVALVLGFVVRHALRHVERV